jgi:hypothetical protein
MDETKMITYTRRMKCAVDMRQKAEESLKKAMVSLKYIDVKAAEYIDAVQHIERGKELIISGNIIVKSITETEHIGELYNESFDDAMELFDSALREVQKVLVMVTSKRNS